MDNTYLCHHGVKGMHWGVRKSPTQESTRKKSLADRLMEKSKKRLESRQSKLIGLAQKYLDSNPDMFEKFEQLSAEQDYIVQQGQLQMQRGARRAYEMQLHSMHTSRQMHNRMFYNHF